MTNWSHVLADAVGRPVDGPGSGAAGGLVAALSALGAHQHSGAEFVMNAIHLDEALHDADAVLTGEGSLDEQSLRGKAVAALAGRAARSGSPVYVIAGRSTLTVEEQHPRRIARGCRVQRDPLGRQREVEQIYVHLMAVAAFLAGAALGAARRAGVMLTGLGAAPGRVTGAPRLGAGAGAIGT